MSLSAERTEAFTEAFEIFGKKAPDIDKHTLSVIMRSLGQNPTNDEVTELFNQEAAGGSKIGLDKVLKIGAEFEAKMNSTDQHAALKEAFAVFDKDKKGKISAAELRHVISNIGEVVDEDELEEMMKEADKDGNGTIEYAEFVHVLLNPGSLPPRVHIPEELKPYMKEVKS